MSAAWPPRWVLVVFAFALAWPLACGGNAGGPPVDGASPDNVATAPDAGRVDGTTSGLDGNPDRGADGGDAGAEAGTDAAAPVARVAAGVTPVSAAGLAQSTSFRLRLSLGAPAVRGTGSSSSFNVRVGPP